MTKRLKENIERRKGNNDGEKRKKNVREKKEI